MKKASEYIGLRLSVLLVWVAFKIYPAISELIIDAFIRDFIDGYKADQKKRWENQTTETKERIEYINAQIEAAKKKRRLV